MLLIDPRDPPTNSDVVLAGTRVTTNPHRLLWFYPRWEQHYHTCSFWSRHDHLQREEPWTCEGILSWGVSKSHLFFNFKIVLFPLEFNNILCEFSCRKVLCSFFPTQVWSYPVIALSRHSQKEDPKWHIQKQQKPKSCFSYTKWVVNLSS